MEKRSRNVSNSNQGNRTINIVGSGLDQSWREMMWTWKIPRSNHCSGCSDIPLVQWKLTFNMIHYFSSALFLVVGLVLYPAGWGNEIVDELCTRPSVQKPGAFVLNDCSVGWAFYAVLGGTLSSFLCSLLSAQAEKSTSSDDVQDEISDGKTLICLI